MMLLPKRCTLSSHTTDDMYHENQAHVSRESSVKQRSLFSYAYHSKSESQSIVESLEIGSYLVPEIRRHR